VAELALLFSLMVLVSQAIFGGWLSELVGTTCSISPDLLGLVCLRFDLPEVTLATTILAALRSGARGQAWAVPRGGVA